MYKLWYSELNKPLILTMDEVRVYVQMMRAMNQGTPRWCKYNEGDAPEWCI